MSSGRDAPPDDQAPPSPRHAAPPRRGHAPDRRWRSPLGAHAPPRAADARTRAGPPGTTRPRPPPPRARSGPPADGMRRGLDWSGWPAWRAPGDRSRTRHPSAATAVPASRRCPTRPRSDAIRSTMPKPRARTIRSASIASMSGPSVFSASDGPNGAGARFCARASFRIGCTNVAATNCPRPDAPDHRRRVTCARTHRTARCRPIASRKPRCRSRISSRRSRTIHRHHATPPIPSVSTVHASLARTSQSPSMMAPHGAARRP